MPRKNQRRKNANSQSGRRKAKPIKFNPSDIENEGRQLGALIAEDGAIDDEQQEQEQDHIQEMESIDGSVSIREDYDDDSGNNQIILNSTLDGKLIDRTNQMDKIDDVQNDAPITIPIAYNDSLAKRTFNCNFTDRNCSFLFPMN